MIEIMIVILLIGLIGGALAFNMRGSMDKGKLFKSEQNAARVYDALMMATATGDFDIDHYNNRTEIVSALRKSSLVKDPAAILKDGWGIDLTITKNADGDLEVYSDKARAWQQAQNAQ